MLWGDDGGDDDNDDDNGDDDDDDDDDDEDDDDDADDDDDSDLVVSDWPRVGSEPAANSDHHNWSAHHLRKMHIWSFDYLIIWLSDYLIIWSFEYLLFIKSDSQIWLYPI